MYTTPEQAQGDKPALVAGEWEELGEGEGQGRDLSFESMAVLRPELLTSFTRHKVCVNNGFGSCGNTPAAFVFYILYFVFVFAACFAEDRGVCSVRWLIFWRGNR